MNKLIEDIIYYGIQAPSGGNSQPWRFEIKSNKLFLYNIPDKDNPVLNFEQTGSYIAHGALIENICIASSHYGYEAKIDLVLNKAKEKDLVAIISFIKTKKNPNSKLFSYITGRHTNRKIYYDKKIDQLAKTEILSVNQNDSGIRILITESRTKRTALAKAVSIMEKIALENKLIHQSFFAEINWKEQENSQFTHGLYIKTLELPAIVEYIFRIIKVWPIVRFLNIFGFSNLVSKTNAKIYGHGGGIGIITIEKYEPIKFIEVGRIMQKIWLIATKHNLYIQPITGIVFLANKIIHNDKIIFKEKHIHEIKKTYSIIREIFNIKKDVVSFVFRIGYADKVTARSQKQPPKIKKV